MKGRTIDMIFAAGFLMIVACVYAYVRAENNDYASFAKDAKDIMLSNQAIVKQLTDLSKNQESFVKVITDQLDKHEKMIEELKAKPVSDKPIAVKISEPLSINVIYRPAKPKPLIPTTEIDINKFGPKTKTMLERAGIKPRVNQ